MPCDVDVLESEIGCIACRPAGTVQAMILVALCRIASELGMACDFDQLESDSSCIACRPPGTVQAMQLAALCNILAAIEGGGGGAGAGCMLSTNGDPEGVLTSTCTPALAVDPNTSAIYLFTGVAGTNTGWALKV